MARVRLEPAAIVPIGHRIVFVDLETTGLDPRRHAVWEIGVVVRDTAAGRPGDREYGWLLKPDLRTAEARALQVGRFYERASPQLSRVCHGTGIEHEGTYPFDGVDPVTPFSVIARIMAELLDGATLAGANPSFDEGFLAEFLRRNGQAGAWRYRKLDVEAYAAGALGLGGHLPGLSDLADKLGVAYQAEDRHTALGDTRLARDVYDAALRLTRDAASAIPAGEG